MTVSVTGTMRVAVGFAAQADYGITDQLARAGIDLSKTHILVSESCDELFHASGSLADEGTVEYDLLTELDPFGVALNLESVMGLYIENTTAAGGANLIIGGAAANPWSAIFGDPADVLVLPPNSAIILPSVEGLVVDATHKAVLLTHDGTGTAALTYKIVIVGKQAT